MKIVSNIIRDNRIKKQDIHDLERNLFFEGDTRRANIERYAVLLFLSSVIATYGVLGDSSATVIGAMIIAPLMKPMMATAAALVMGHRERAFASFIIVALGIAGVVLTAWFIARFLNPTIISFSTNSEVTERIAPSLTDLAVAVAAGTAGAFAMSRSDVADSLPGVAISIALVPPLCVAGIGLAEANWRVARGALLLFTTNFLSILTLGGGVFAVLGLSAASTSDLPPRGRRRTFAIIVVGLLIIAMPLAATTINVALDTREEIRTRQLTQDWLDESDYSISRVNSHEDIIEVTINGSGELPPIETLGETIQSELGPRVQLEVLVVPSQTHRYP